MSRVEEALATLRRVPAKKILVGVSGGKDSLCTLDMCVRHFGKENVAGYLMTLVEGLECEWRTIRPIERRYGIKVHSVPHYELSKLLRDCAYRPYVKDAEKIPVLKQVDVENHLRKTLGFEWVALGMRAADSIVRNAYLKRIAGVDVAGRRVYPIWTWKKPDVYGYLAAKRLPKPMMIGGSQKATSGVSLFPPVLVWIRDNFPEDYRKILNVFPYAAAAVFRWERMGGREQTLERERARRRVKKAPDGEGEDVKAAEVVRDEDGDKLAF